jgi:hypothetical protein
MPRRNTSLPPRSERSRAANRRWRERRKQGKMLMTVEVDGRALAGGLQDYNYLSQNRDSFKRTEVVTALERFLMDQVCSEA